MKKLIIACSALATLGVGYFLIAADHIDAPAVGSLTEGSSAADITDYYAFESKENPDNYVFVVNVQGLTAPAATANASFDEEVMYEINIDNNADNVEDLVIQAIFRNGNVVVFGPTAPAQAGLSGKVETAGTRVSTAITAYGDSPVVGTNGGIKVFAGPREDPFFMDFFQFVSIVNGVGAALGDDVNTGVYDPNRDSDPDTEGVQPYPASFKGAEATDTFAGSNVLSVVIELPKSSLGTSATFTSWAESKRKQ